MKITGTVTKTIHWTSTCEDPGEVVRTLRDKYPGIRIDIVDGREVVDVCEACDAPLYDGSVYGTDSEGISLCGSCMVDHD